MLQKDPSIDAIFSISDIGAVRIIQHLKTKGIRIPRDICVAGFGGEPMGEIIEPGLTTFNPQTYKIGETVARLFFDQIIEGEDYIAKTKIVKGYLIVRESSLRLTKK
jgi:DNA-binding LacI/PurR family transcriptional regulator